MTEIFTAKTVEEAKNLAAQKFGKSVSDIRFEVLEEGKKGGFLGLGAKDARVKATFDEPAAAAEAAPAPAAAPVAEKIEKAAETVAEPVKEAVEAPAAAAEAEPAAVTAEPAAPAEDEEDFSLDSFTLIENESDYDPKVKIAKDYITSILRAMGIDAEYTVYQNETGAVINIESDNNGTIIGRRGETLDSIQYLCSIIANKGDKDYFRITIDCLGYRSKRKETLQQLANKVAKSVLRTGRSQPLEPMNPYERRVIHSAISKIDGVSSRSVGEEPYRKIIISSNNPKSGGRGRGRNNRDDRRGGDRRGNGRRRERREPFEPRAIDLSTSFEKDYKKPKPEDNMEGGLYGKIEL
ncbi:MAG: protein jag [Ruminococcus sp.]|nr:protein jag [Ruminococcus sp.]